MYFFISNTISYFRGNLEERKMVEWVNHDMQNNVYVTKVYMFSHIIQKNV